MEKFLRRRDVEAVTGLKRTAIADAIAAGTFPKPVPVTGRARAWVQSEIEDWQKGRIAQRDAKPDAA
jgi:prophage regulatory protein